MFSLEASSYSGRLTRIEEMVQNRVETSPNKASCIDIAENQGFLFLVFFFAVLGLSYRGTEHVNQIHIVAVFIGL